MLRWCISIRASVNTSLQRKRGVKEGSKNVHIAGYLHSAKANLASIYTYHTPTLWHELIGYWIIMPVVCRSCFKTKLMKRLHRKNECAQVHEIHLLSERALNQPYFFF